MGLLPIQKVELLKVIKEEMLMKIKDPVKKVKKAKIRKLIKLKKPMLLIINLTILQASKSKKTMKPIQLYKANLYMCSLIIIPLEDS